MVGSLGRGPGAGTLPTVTRRPLKQDGSGSSEWGGGTYRDTLTLSVGSAVPKGSQELWVGTPPAWDMFLPSWDTFPPRSAPARHQPAALPLPQHLLLRPRGRPVAFVIAHAANGRSGQ